MINPKRDLKTISVMSPDLLEFNLSFVEYITLRAEIKRHRESGWGVFVDEEGLQPIREDGSHLFSERCFTNVDDALMYLAFGLT